jgi:hypothetical protein
MPILETMEPKKPRPRRSFTPKFEAEIVEHCRRGDRSIRHTGWSTYGDRNPGFMAHQRLRVFCHGG